MSSPQPRPAATVILARDAERGIELYMARRSARSAFMPDAYVFPGGALDEDDAAPRAVGLLDAIPAGVEPAFAVAALRELFEEAGVLMVRTAAGSDVPERDLEALRGAVARADSLVDLVARNSWRLAGSSLTYYSRWVTPPGEVARRFDARFFVARSPRGQTAVADAVELHDGVWTTPADALRRGKGGEWMLVFPTIRHLERLRDFRTVDALVASARERRPFAVMPDLSPEGVISLPPALENW